MSKFKDEIFERHFQKAASLVKWKRISIPFAVAVVTSNPSGALLLIERLRKSF